MNDINNTSKELTDILETDNDKFQNHSLLAADDVAAKNQVSGPEDTKFDERKLIEEALTQLQNATFESYPTLAAQMNKIMRFLTAKYSDPKTPEEDKIPLHAVITELFDLSTVLSESIINSRRYKTNLNGIELIDGNDLTSAAVHKNNIVTFERLKKALLKVPAVLNSNNISPTSPDTEPTQPIPFSDPEVPPYEPEVGIQRPTVPDTQTNTADMPTQVGSPEVPATTEVIDAAVLQRLSDLEARVEELQSLNSNEELIQAIKDYLQVLRNQDNETIERVIEGLTASIDNLAKSMENNSIVGVAKRAYTESEARLAGLIEKIANVMPTKLNLNLRMPEMPKMFKGVTKETLKKAMRNILIGAGAGTAALGTGAGLTALAMLNPPLFALLIGSTATIAGGAGVVGASTYATLNSYNWIRRQGAALMVGDADKRLMQEKDPKYLEFHSGLNMMRNFDSMGQLVANDETYNEALGIFAKYLSNPVFADLLGTANPRDAAEELVRMFFQDFKSEQITSSITGMVDLYNRIMEEDKKNHRGLLMYSIRRERTEQEFRHQSFRETSAETLEVLKMTESATRKALGNTVSKVGKGFWAGFKRMLNRKK